MADINANNDTLIQLDALRCCKSSQVTTTDEATPHTAVVHRVKTSLKSLSQQDLEVSLIFKLTRSRQRNTSIYKLANRTLPSKFALCTGQNVQLMVLKLGGNVR